MANPRDYYPDNNFEFSIDDLKEPTAATRQAFNEVLGQINFEGSSSRSVEVGYQNDNQSSSLVVNVSEKYEPDGSHSYSHIGLSVHDGDDYFSVGAGRSLRLAKPEQLEKAQRIIDELADGLPEEEQDWLLAAWSDLRINNDSLLDEAVKDLLEKSPYAVLEHSLKFAKRMTFNNGTLFHGSKMTGNEVFMDMAKEEDIMLLDIDVHGPDGKQYEYSLRASGKEDLTIEDPKKSVPLEGTAAPEIIEEEVVSGVHLSIRGTPEFMRFEQAVRAARAKAKSQGLFEVTEGKLRELTRVISEAVASGKAGST